MKMANNEKWPEIERRVEDRIRLTVDIEWDSNDGRHPGTLSDLNSTGCFILASGFFTEGATVRVHLPITESDIFVAVGEIVNQYPDLGFALRFMNLTDEQRQSLNDFARQHEST